MSIFERASQSRPEHKPSRRRQLAEQSSEAGQRARDRRTVARLAYELPGSLRQKRAAIVAAQRAELIGPNAPISIDSIARFAKRWEAGERSIVDYYDQPRSGRPEHHLSGVARSYVLQSIREGDGKSARQLWRELKKLSQERGFREPSLRQINKIVRSNYRLRHSAARHGSRAGEIDGLPHPRIATTNVHDVWCLDELTMPIWVRIPDYDLGGWASVLCDAVIIVDVRSSAVVGWHIADPTGRLNPEGRQVEGGARDDDVLGALLSAACPELAPPSTADFAGYLPLALRWDNHQAHKSLGRRIIDHELDVDPRFIRKRRAISNSPVETRVRVLKGWLGGMRGHVDRYLPTDRIDSQARVDQMMHRTGLAGGSGDRVTEKLPVSPSDLMDIHELRDAFDVIVATYNHDHVNRVFNQTAAQRYLRYLHPRRARNGRDLLLLLEPEETIVNSGGIVLHRNNEEHQYLPLVGQSMLMLDATVIYRADPLLRGIFIERDGKHFFAERSRESTEMAREIARNQIAIARQLSDQAKSARRARRDAVFGASAAMTADQEYEDATRRWKGARGQEATDEGELPGPTEPNAGEGHEFDPYADPSIDRFVGGIEPTEDEDV